MSKLIQDQSEQGLGTSWNKFGQVLTSLDKFSPVWKFGQVWTSSDKFGQVWTSLERFGQVWTIWTHENIRNMKLLRKG